MLPDEVGGLAGCNLLHVALLLLAGDVVSPHRLLKALDVACEAEQVKKGALLFSTCALV
jgi:hypothetical protein